MHLLRDETQTKIICFRVLSRISRANQSLRTSRYLRETSSHNKMPPDESQNTMKNFLLLITFLSVIWFSGCEEPMGPQNSASIANAVYPRSEGTDRRIKEDITKFAAAAKGKVGAGAVDLETGEYFSLNGDGHYPMQSVYKLPISLAVVKMYENQRLDLDQKVKVTKEDLVSLNLHSPLRDSFSDGTEMSVRDLIKYALEESDGTASDVLMRIVGGPEKVQDYLATLGITDMKVVNTEKEMSADWQVQYQNWSTPAAAVDLLQALYEGRALATETGREMVLRMMTSSKPGANRMRGMLDDAPVAHKTGTSGTQNGITAATNDIGILSLPNGKHMAVAVFVSDSPADEKAREATIAKITKIFWNYWKR
jgi:beta-lactamase class A